MLFLPESQSAFWVQSGSVPDIYHQSVRDSMQLSLVAGFVKLFWQLSWNTVSGLIFSVMVCGIVVSSKHAWRKMPPNVELMIHRKTGSKRPDYLLR